jgi:hypothetical protein
MHISSKHFKAIIEFDEDHVTIAIAPIWDSAWRHTLDIVLHRDRLREELDEQLRDLLHVLAETRKVIERKLGSTAIDVDKSESSEIDGDEKG